MHRMAALLSLLMPLVIGSPGLAFVPPYGWGYASPPGGAGVRAAFAVSNGADDGLDWMDGAGEWGGSYRENGRDGWDGPTGFYTWDIRALLTPGQTKTWDIYFWNRWGSQLDHIEIGWFLYAELPIPPIVTAKLECTQVPEGMSGAPAVGTVWTTPPLITLPWPPPPSDPFGGYAFHFTLSMIPEPSSLAAILAGLAGFGVVLRRRRN